MFHIRWSLLAVLAAGLLALSGCGSTKTKTVEIEVPGPEVEVPGPEVEVPVPVGPPDFVDLSGVPEDAMVADSESMEIEAGGSVTIGEVMYSCAAGDVGCTVTVEDGAAVSTGGAVTAMVTQAYHTRKATEAKVAADTKAAGTKEKAIMAEMDQTADAGLGGSARTDEGTTTADDTSDDLYSLKISRDSDGTKVTISDPHYADKEKDPQFMDAMAGLDAGRTMLTRKMKADSDGNVMEEVAIVGTDIEAPKAVAFAKFAVVAEDGTRTTPQVLNVNAQGATATGVAAVAFDPGAALASSDAAQKAILDNMMSTSFAKPGAGVESIQRDFLPARADDPSTTDVDETRAAAMVAGYYNGAMGTYICSGTANCSVTVNAKGELTAATDGWIFKPADGATSDQPDYDYTHYGVWLKKTMDSDGVVTYNEVETFADSRLNESGAVTAVLGSATYEGGAVGVYVHEVVNSDGSRASATSGHFKADVSLTAIFGQVPVSDTDSTGTIAPNLLNTVSGTIDKFDLSGGEANTWSVALSGDITDSSGTVADGKAEGGMGDGSLSATFHGTVAADTAPSSVVGEFNAGFTNGSVAGAFGASEVKE